MQFFVKLVGNLTCYIVHVHSFMLGTVFRETEAVVDIVVLSYVISGCLAWPGRYLAENQPFPLDFRRQESVTGFVR